ncbi:hypothetical protein MAR_018716 [Mya arenaria]|uniref:Secreted protein n=1 Tax=Mya arenaria TaxID=6604 RepID=A0ABY7EFF7_MYAAR|nr:hypothetical protein MAR_018716 [Mya arenaria]
MFLQFISILALLQDAPLNIHKFCTADLSVSYERDCTLDFSIFSVNSLSRLCFVIQYLFFPAEELKVFPALPPTCEVPVFYLLNQLLFGTNDYFSSGNSH